MEDMQGRAKSAHIDTGNDLDTANDLETANIHGSFLTPQRFSERVRETRRECFIQDGRFSNDSICNLRCDSFDPTALHLLFGKTGAETGAIRLSLYSAQAGLPFVHFYPDFKQELSIGDSEISRFILHPTQRGALAALILIEGVVRTAANLTSNRIFIDVVTGATGLKPRSYTKHLGFVSTGLKGFDEDYDSASELMVLDGLHNIQSLAEKLRADVLGVHGRHHEERLKGQGRWSSSKDHAI